MITIEVFNSWYESQCSRCAYYVKMIDSKTVDCNLLGKVELTKSCAFFEHWRRHGGYGKKSHQEEIAVH